jgi:murein DD-endopeptidase MepM/ murein hydrolase activator NlpD
MRHFPRLLALLSLGCAAACNANPQIEEAPAAAPRTAVAMAQTPAPSPPPEPVVPATLTFDGELTQGGWIRGTAPGNSVSLTLDGTSVPLAPDGSFFAAFDRDAGASARLVAKLSDGRTVARDITVSPRAWNIERVNVARRSGGPTEAFMAIRRPELAQINAARAKDTGAGGWKQDFIWPVKGRISGRFGSQRIYRGEPGSYHSGIDIATGGSGTPFVAPADGVVILAAKAPFTLEGHLLMIDHGNGLNSAFLHCSAILVDVGDTVRQGQVIGRIGMSGRATGPHLHWGLKWQKSRLDPLLFTGPMD